MSKRDSLLGRKSTRLQRLSAYLPNLNTSESKRSQAPPLPARKALPERSRRPSESPSPPLPPLPSSAPADLTEHASKLHKPMPPARSPPQLPADANGSSPNSVTPGRLTKVRPQSPNASPRGSPSVRAAGRRGSLVPPPVFNDMLGSRTVSAPVASEESKLPRRSWMPGGKSRNTSQNTNTHTQSPTPPAWIIAGEHKIDYGLTLLTHGEKIPELWDEDKGDTFVYLFPRSSGCGASFKVSSILLSSSQPLLNLIHGDIYAGRPRAASPSSRAWPLDEAATHPSLRGPGTPPYTPKTNPLDNISNSDGSADSLTSLSDPPREIHLYFPGILILPAAPGQELPPEDIQSLIAIRNLFAFLTGQPLVATRECHSLYRIFMAIAALLQQLDFTNFDGSTYGEAADASFRFFMHELKLADVTHSREKTLEALVLGERMRSMELYTEAFAHAAGKYASIMSIKSPLYDELSVHTRHRLERASLDLKQRQQAAEIRLTDFDFPSMFSGIGNSTSRPEARAVNFKSWKANFLAFRKALLSHYKHLHGQWPPKASSKKNQFEENGLNRLVLKGLYKDLSDLYDLLANREALTTRHYDASDDAEVTNVEPTVTVLRTVLGEYDRSSPPVQPPIPFDVPRIPTMATVNPTYPSLSPKDQHKMSTRKLKSHEMLLLLAKSHNLDCDYKTPFLEMYKAFEEKEAKGKNALELADQRYGHWLFLYAVIQSLPMLVVDVPGLHYTSGAEYFLCEPPLGNAPWMDESGVKMAWYGVQGGAGVVSLPSDVVVHGVEGIYRRSHCWTVAEKWISEGEQEALSAPAPLTEDFGGILSPLEPPPGFGEAGSRPSSRGRDRSDSQGSLSPYASDNERRSRSRTSYRASQRNSIALGLEQLPIPSGMGASTEYLPNMGSRHGSASRGASPGPGMLGHSHMRSISRSRGDSPSTEANRGSTFDDILGTSLKAPVERKDRRKSFISFGDF
ncbi:hypothetical protein BP6252_02826 [Coleophoma cylindrospora]|uniref:DUF8004 domain-containing protein n=1 Tax=Coleophoma cylindrospora TaxID=1849047 RepID=A0A3D8SG17_9HELO|nr:hypothetical protein BP6252_02826 [Coleophoma cylindrospora]